jgi:hypothetical protein
MLYAWGRGEILNSEGMRIFGKQYIDVKTVKFDKVNNRM